MFKRKKKDYDNLDWGDNEEVEEMKLMIKAAAVILTFMIAGFLFLRFWIKDPQPYDLALDLEESPDLSEVVEIKEESKKSIEKETIEVSKWKIKDMEIHIEAYKPDPIGLKPMLDGTSSDLYSELKKLPIESTYSEEISVKLKDENIGSYDEKKLTQEVSEINMNKEASSFSPRKSTVDDESIEKLKSYDEYKLTGDGKLSRVYKSFETMYNKNKDMCEWINNRFHPSKIPYYKGALVTWYTHDRLIYSTPLSQRGIRGVLKLKYYSDNKYGLKKYKEYKRDVEYRLKFRPDGDFLNEIIYLSDWKEAK